MSDSQTLYLLGKIAESLESILQRAEGVHSTDDLLSSPGGMLLLATIYEMEITIKQFSTE